MRRRGVYREMVNKHIWQIFTDQIIMDIVSSEQNIANEKQTWNAHTVTSSTQYLFTGTGNPATKYM